MPEIVPAIIPKSFSDLEEKVGAVIGAAAFVQVDVCDGKFVSAKSWPYSGDENGNFQKILHEERGLPYWQKIDYEVHIMAETPYDEVAEWAKTGAIRAIVHIEAGSDTFHQILEEWGKVLEIGIAAKIETPLSPLEAYFDEVNLIQLMSIKRLGFQGEKFDDTALDRIVELRRLGFKHIISIDGGVNLENAPKLLNAGADRLIVGSALWEKGIPRENLATFNVLAKS